MTYWGSACSQVETEAKKILSSEGRIPTAKVQVGPAADICKHSQKILKSTWPDRCVLQSQQSYYLHLMAV